MGRNIYTVTLSCGAATSTVEVTADDEAEACDFAIEAVADSSDDADRIEVERIEFFGTTSEAFRVGYF